MKLVVDHPPAHDHDRRSGDGFEQLEPGERRASRALHAQPRGGKGSDSTGDRALGYLDHGRLQRDDLVHRDRHGHAHGHPVGEGGRAVARDRAPGGNAERHDRSRLGHHPDGTTRQRAGHADQQRAVAHGDHHPRGRRPELLLDLVPERRIPGVLRGLGSVLEEGQALLGGPELSPLLGLVEIPAHQVQLGSELAEHLQLRRARSLRRKHHRTKAEPLRGPRAGGSVVARRGRDHRLRSARGELAQRGQRAAPLEGPELVHVLALEPQRRHIGEPGRGLLERSGIDWGGHCLRIVAHRLVSVA